jgi:hypothetical protein
METEHAKVETRKTREMEMKVNFFQNLTVRFICFGLLKTLFPSLYPFHIAGERERLCQKMAFVVLGK